MTRHTRCTLPEIDDELEFNSDPFGPFAARFHFNESAAYDLINTMTRAAVDLTVADLYRICLTEKPSKWNDFVEAGIYGGLTRKQRIDRLVEYLIRKYNPEEGML